MSHQWGAGCSFVLSECKYQLDIEPETDTRRQCSMHLPLISPINIHANRRTMIHEQSIEEPWISGMYHKCITSESIAHKSDCCDVELLLKHAVLLNSATHGYPTCLTNAFQKMHVMRHSVIKTRTPNDHIRENLLKMQNHDSTHSSSRTV